MITILSTRTINIEGIAPFRHADIIISDGQQSFSLGVGGLPLDGDLQPILESRFDELWLAAIEKNIVPPTEIVYKVAVHAPDFVVSAPPINPDPELALKEAIREMEKSDGNPKSIALIALSLAKYLKSKRDKLK